MGILSRTFVVLSLMAGAFVGSVGYSEGFGGARAPIVADRIGGSRLIQNAETKVRLKEIEDEHAGYYVPGVYAAERF